jgi:peptidyl-prolyl cis-trans isomerase SurA
LRSKTDIHKANLSNDFQVIKKMLVEKTSAEFIQNWIQKKQQETYVHIDPKWRGCDFQYPGWVHEDNE